MKLYKLMIAVILIFLVFLLFGCADIDKLNETKQSEASKLNINTDVPIINDTFNENDYINMNTLGREEYIYITSKNDEIKTDPTNETIPGFLDIVSVKKYIDDKDIYFYIELRELPETLTINKALLNASIIEYSWRINFDVDCDNTIAYDITLAHHNFWDKNNLDFLTTINCEAFKSDVEQHQVSSGQTIAQFSMDTDKNTMIFHIEKSAAEQLKDINEETPFFVFNEYIGSKLYLYDLYPRR